MVRFAVDRHSTAMFVAESAMSPLEIPCRYYHHWLHMGCNLASVFPDCLGCGATVPESAIYCGKCSRAIKAHNHAAQNRDRLEAEAKAKQRAALNWPIEERGDLPGKWLMDTARAEFPLLSSEEREAVAERQARHEWAASQKRMKRSR